MTKRFTSALVAALLCAPAMCAAQEIDAANTGWILTSTALVLFMTIPGLSLFYAGLVRQKNVLSVLMQCFAITCAASIVWFAVGYSLTFTDGGSANAWIGGLSQMFMQGVLEDSVSGAIPESVFAMFQMTFAIITPALIVGAFAERMKFSAMLLFSVIWLIVVYAPVTHWVWGGGWLGSLGLLDFAGGTVVHITAGVAALVSALMIGRRRGFPEQPLMPHSLPLTVTGAGMLWVGWFGFNAGSALAANGDAGMAMLVTHLSAAAGSLAWMTMEWIRHCKPGIRIRRPRRRLRHRLPGRRGLLQRDADHQAEAAHRRLAGRLPGARRRRHARHISRGYFRLGRSRTVQWPGLQRGDVDGQPGLGTADRHRRHVRIHGYCQLGHLQAG